MGVIINKITKDLRGYIARCYCKFIVLIQYRDPTGKEES